MALPLATGLPGLARAAAEITLEEDDLLLRAVIAGQHRSAANRARDGARHPYETLRFFGLRPHHTVIEITPGEGWYTEILAPYLLARGRYIAAQYAHDAAQEYRRDLRFKFQAKLAHNSPLYGQVQVGTFSEQGTLVNAGRRGNVDAVLTFRNVHNWIEADHLDASLKAISGALKTGGVLGVEDHRAPPGTPLARVKETGYVTEALLLERARAAGFELVETSEVNANPKDTKDHPNGVWSLPPTLRGGEVDRNRYLAIGESDRFTHRYVKVV
ncbi:MAG: methyltransferase [Rubrivivax sp.]|nr:MAG: methyltransferase [Rubrivivax sp.]